jgi:DMSO/TMAO reductase YedYZ molybdopterin-dependent catalytic subunit
MSRISRRRFVHCSLCASSAWALGACDGDPSATDGGMPDGGMPDGGMPDGGIDDAGPHDASAQDSGTNECDDAFAGGSRIGAVAFVGEDLPLETRLGVGWDGRLYTDLARVDRGREITPTESFYIRTFFPDRLHTTVPWRIEVGGLVETPAIVTLDDLAPLVVDQGVHVLECSGNGARGAFGLLSAASWAGAPLPAVLDRVAMRPEAARVLVSGFDDHSVPSAGGHSSPGASWIFGFDQIERAFLATEMNGAPLPPDHGAPVRLLVPGWYGCTCIKWVNEIRLVAGDEPATSQMIEFAGRTHQIGVPALARDYLPASMDQAAMPIRIEKWRVAGSIVYRVIGILWGGSTPTAALSFSDGESSAPVDVCPPPTQNSTWTIWQHAWRPSRAGDFALRMRIDDETIRTRRLDRGYYERVARIDEV